MTAKFIYHSFYIKRPQIKHYAQKMSEIDADMPIILEHLDTDDQYIKHINYLKEVLDGLYKTI